MLETGIRLHHTYGLPIIPGSALKGLASHYCAQVWGHDEEKRSFRRNEEYHKFLFGTDAPLLEPSFVLGTYQDADIPADQQDDVYYGNAARLFGLG